MAEPEKRKKHPIRNRVILYGLVLGFIYFVIPRRMLFPGNDQPLPTDASKLVAGASVVEYRTEDGVALRGCWVKPRVADPLTVLYFHGNAESAASGVPLALALAARGVQTFLAEYRGYGGCKGSPCESGLYQDGAAALEVVKAAGVKEERLVLVGRSLGTGVAVELASKGHGCGLLLVSPYTSITDVARGIVGPLAPLLVRDSFDSLARIGSVKVPVVAIHGTKDTLIPFALGQRLVAAARHGRLVPVEGRGHNDLDEENLLAKELAAWTEKR